MMLAGVPVLPYAAAVSWSATLVVTIQEAHDRSVPKIDPPPMYACMMPKSDLRRVQQPHDERVVITRRPLRRMLAKLAGTVRL